MSRHHGLNQHPIADSGFLGNLCVNGVALQPPVNPSPSICFERSSFCCKFTYLLNGIMDNKAVAVEVALLDGFSSANMVVLVERCRDITVRKYECVTPLY